MRILFADIIPDATITALHAVSNYPASNIAHVFLRKRYQCTGDEDTITCVYTSDKSANCVFYGWHVNPETDLETIDSMTVNLRDISDALLHSETISPLEEPGAAYFDLVEGVRKIEIELSGSADLFLGKLSSGVYYQAKDPEAGWEKLSVDNSVVTRSAGGQTLQTRVEPLRIVEPKWASTWTPAEWREFYGLYSTKGKGATLWVDMTELDHDYYAPLYCSFVDAPDPGYDSPKYGPKTQLMESR